jgi:hypothetical protein
MTPTAARLLTALCLAWTSSTAPAARAQETPAPQPSPSPRPECHRGDRDCRVLNIAGHAGLAGSYSRAPQPEGIVQRAALSAEGGARLVYIPQRPHRLLLDVRARAQRVTDFSVGNVTAGDLDLLEVRSMAGIKGGTPNDLVQATYYVGGVLETRRSGSAVVPREASAMTGAELGLVGAGFRGGMSILLGGYALGGTGRVRGQEGTWAVTDAGGRLSLINGLHSIDVKLGERRYRGDTDLGVAHTEVTIAWPLHARRGISAAAFYSQEGRKRVGEDLPGYGSLPRRRDTAGIGIAWQFGGNRNARSGRASARGGAAR